MFDAAMTGSVDAAAATASEANQYESNMQTMSKTQFSKSQTNVVHPCKKT